ncbi:hypothetical protein [Cellulomonas sp. B6]|uniref:hypothetical protein n=1 Tax=Cellulomonas sp. B6 TaxID=1295626 RepID=UPI00073BA27D|nr:hypothetical protein [Cellulomonas sp. B6]KSW29915.1 hypothetical protein ATM99_00275 [Cellulomonas sp. B6]
MTIETSGDGPLAPFDAVWDAVATLPTPARAMFALACAERLARAAGRDDELSEALEAGWAAADGQPADLAPLRSELEDRDDLDDDDPAATYFALGAAAGSVKDCRAAANRAMDAAFARVTYPAGATTFRPLADDAAEPPVQDELAWQRAAATRLADDGPTDDVRAWLRR